MKIIIGGSKGVLGRRPRAAPISFIFIQFSAKILQIISFCQLLRGWHLPPVWEILDPPLIMKSRPSKGRESLQLLKSANVLPHWRPHPPQGDPASATAISVADLHSNILDAHLFRGPNSFIFMQFLGNFGKIVC